MLLVFLNESPLSLPQWHFWAKRPHFIFLCSQPQAINSPEKLSNSVFCHWFWGAMFLQVKTLIAVQVTSLNICGFLLQPVSLLVSFAMVTSKGSFFPIHPQLPSAQKNKASLGFYLQLHSPVLDIPAPSYLSFFSSLEGQGKPETLSSAQNSNSS